MNFCSNSNMLTVILIIKYIFKIVCIILPFLVMYRSFVSCFKSVVSGESLSKGLTGMIKSLIAALIVFVLPVLFNYFFTNIGYDLAGDLSVCYNNATVERIEMFKDAEETNRQDELAQRLAELDKAIIKNKENEQKRNEMLQELRDEFNKNNPQNNNANNGSSDVVVDSDNSSNSGNGSGNNNGSSSNNNGSSNGGNGLNNGPSSSDVNLSAGTMNIIIGDSRTVGMCASMTGDWSNCQFNVGGAFTSGNDIYIAQGSQGYSWFNSSAVSAANQIIASNHNVKFNIYSLMGVNFLLSDINKYIPRYKELATNDWKNHNLFLVSVNPVDEVIEAQYGYSTKNVNIISFNNQLKIGTSGVSNIKYCDTYNTIINNLNTSDGLHYQSSTYKAIYSNMKAC